MTWTDNASNESGFELYRSMTGATGAFQLHAWLPSNAAGYSETQAQPGTQYCFKVRAVRKTGARSAYSGFSNTACATTPEPPPPPPPPPPEAAWGLYAIPENGTEIYLGWSVSGSASGFRLERSLDGGSDWESLATTTAASFFDTGLTSDQQVCYRVIAYNPYGEASPSSAACTAPPAAPTNLTGTKRADGAIEFRWTDNSAVEDGYEVGSLPANATSFVCYDECLGRPTLVMAAKDSGRSDMSNAVEIW